MALAILLASLGYFKYSDFVYQSLQTAFGGASWFYHPTFLATILPLGISFYTFQIVAYFIDLRKGRTEHAKSFDIHRNATSNKGHMGNLIAPIRRCRCQNAATASV